MNETSPDCGDGAATLTTAASAPRRVIRLSPLARFGAAIALAVVAVLIRLALDPIWGTKLPYITLFPAIMVSAWLGGLWPGVVTTLLCGLAAQYYFIEPTDSLRVANTGELLGLAVFGGVGAVISALNEAWRRGTTAVLESEKRLSVTLSSIGDAVITVDGTGCVTRFNPVAEALTGWPAADVIGKPLQNVFSIIDEETRQAVPDPVNRVLQDGVPMSMANHTLLVARDGREIPIEDSAAPIRTDDGRLAGVVMVFRDVTERRRVERERAVLFEREQAARADLERASRLKDEFLAVLSHELRTPLNAVLGYARLLESGALSEDRARHAVNAIQRNALAQTRLVGSLLDLSRVMAGKLQLDLERVDVSSIVDAALDVIRPDADAKSIALTVTAPPTAVTLAGDGARLQQVFWNLLSNSVKFTPRGGKIAVTIAAHRDDVHVTVTDDGQGISPTFLPHVFDRFTQAEGHKGLVTTGLGLGLALVREMVQAHGGTVTADSPGAGGGSTFTVRLPRLHPTAATATAAVTPTDSVDSLPSVDILIVDDDRDARDLLALLLESRGASVRTVASAADALESIRRHRPDVLLADLGMPEEDGISLIRKLRARESDADATRLPAIAVTGFASVVDREQAIAAGYDGHIAKPVEPDALARAIAKVIE